MSSAEDWTKPDRARQAWGWPEDAVVEPGPRGALGQIWHIRTPGAEYALKEIFGEPPSEAVIAAEQSFAQAVRIPQGHKDVEGRYLVPTQDGTWLRVSDWIDPRPVDLTDPATPEALGTLLARLHRAAPAQPTEIDGGPPDPWFDVLDADSELADFVTPGDPAEMVLCHRDLHPENVLTDARGELVVVDWDLLGPATPSRELARALFDWYSDPEPDLSAMRRMLWAYKKEGGTGRVAQPHDFAMLVATRCNFLQRQRAIAADVSRTTAQRAWAEREVAEFVRIMPTRDQLSAVLELDSSARRR